MILQYAGAIAITGNLIIVIASLCDGRNILAGYYLSALCINVFALLMGMGYK